MPGCVVILNGAPRAGKSSIADALIERSGDGWINLGVDAWMARTPTDMLPGIGLRPGGERPDLEPFVQRSYGELFEAVAAMARTGTNVVVDVGLHDSYSRPLGIREDAERRLALPNVLWVSVRCDLGEIVRRRERSDGTYAARDERGGVAAPVEAWTREVHRAGRYDVEVDTTTWSAAACAARIAQEIAERFAG